MRLGYSPKRRWGAEMCIGVIWQANPTYPFILLLNRDENHSRLTKPLEWWEDGEVVGGRDGFAGGTWLACTKHGKLAFLNNVRELQSLPQPKSRGHLPVRFLEVRAKKILWSLQRKL